MNYTRNEENITYQMRIPHLLQHANIIKLDIQELIDGFQPPLQREIVLQLYDHGLVDEGLEEARRGEVLVRW